MPFGFSCCHTKFGHNFDHTFDRILDEVTFPTGLQEMDLGALFNRPSGYDDLPARRKPWREKIFCTLPAYHPLNAVKFPESPWHENILCTLHAYHPWNAVKFPEGPLDAVKFPARRQELDFGLNVNQTLNRIPSPAMVRERNVNRPLTGTNIPSGLKHTAFGCVLKQQVDEVT